MEENHRLFVEANVGRAGLGNMLFPWARAEIFAKEHRCPMLAPQWMQPKIGPMLRRERDLRYYTGLFSSRGYRRGLGKLLVKLRARRVEEGEFHDQPTAGITLVTFTGMQGDYEPLYAHREFVAARLREILSPRCKELLQAQESDGYIGVHARCGDKAPLEYGKPFPVPNSASRLPLQWFVNCINNIRRMIGRPVAVKVFSDGRESELKELLSLENVTLAPSNPSIVDILLLARSRVLVTTGSSSFSSWAAFLGGMPAVWYPQSTFWAPTLLQRLGAKDPAAQPQTTLTGELPPSFAAVLRNTF
ncbi:MAG TPA: hypothetical protein VH370_04130 [Humisphaera sp.]|jgi:hypothetical protein|nr:hypothetical protein [Humisphaera sp.]